MGFDTIEINLIFLVASKMGLVIVLANLASEMKPSLDFFVCVNLTPRGFAARKIFCQAQFHLASSSSVQFELRFALYLIITIPHPPLG